MRVARTSWLHEPVWAAIAATLLRELDLERNRIAPSSQPPGIPAALTKSGTPVQAYAAATDVAIGRALAEAGPESALARLDRSAEFVRGARLAPLANILGAMRVSLLIDAGRAGDAERVWREEGFPGDARACLDLEGRSWREMEALGGARLRLFTASERFGEAREFAAELRAAAGVRGLRRTFMRALGVERRPRGAGGVSRPLRTRILRSFSRCSSRPTMPASRSWNDAGVRPRSSGSWPAQATRRCARRRSRFSRQCAAPTPSGRSS